MAKSSTRAIFKGIVDYLADGAKSINEVAEKTGFDRIAVTKYLEILRDSNIVSETDKGRMRIFELKCQFGLRDDTYFGLPLDEEKERLIDSLYSTIKQEWIKKAKREPAQLQVQKVLYKVNKICGLNLPMGWYLFGALCVKPYNPDCCYVNSELPAKVITCVQEVIQEYSIDKFAYQTKIRHYEEEKNEFYLLKEAILRIFYSSNFSQKYLYEINKKIKELFKMAPKNGNDTYFEIMEEYPDLIAGLLICLDEKKLNEIKPEVIGSFEDVWKLIALYNFKNDLLEDGFYKKEGIERYFILDIARQEREIIERCAYLQSLIPPEEESQDPDYRKIKEMLSRVKQLNQEESRKKKQDQKILESEKGLGAVNEKLIKEFGLD